MAQNRRRQQTMQRRHTPQLPMSKWDFERIASQTRSSNRLHRLNDDRECYFHNCKMMVSLIGDEVLNFNESQKAFGSDHWRDRKGVFNDEPNSPDAKEFLSSAGCNDWLQYLKKPEDEVFQWL